MIRTSTLMDCVLPSRSIAPLLEHAEQLHLHVGRQLADLVEEEGRLVGGFEAADLPRDRAVYAPRSWPKSSLSMSALGIAAQLTRIIWR